MFVIATDSIQVQQFNSPTSRSRCCKLVDLVHIAIEVVIPIQVPVSEQCE